MLLPLTHLPASPFPPKILTDQYLSPCFSFPKSLPSQTPKPSKFAIRSSTTGTKTLAPKSAIQRIAEKLRSLGFTENNQKPQPQPDTKSAGEIFVPLPQRLPKYRVGHTLDSSWSTPENPVPEPGTGRAIARFHELKRDVKKQKELEKTGKKEERVPTLAELSLGKGELRRLTTVGIGLRKKLKIGKAGITEGIVNGIHENWRRSEVVKIVCEDLCRMNMKRTHDMLERKTGGLVVWRSGSKIVLYRGVNYKYPYFLRDKADEDSTIDASHNALPDEHINDGINEIADEVNSAIIPSTTNERAQPMLVKGVGLQDRVRFQLPGEAQLTEEADRMLDGLGPRFTDWWGYEPLPVDADLLPAIVPGYRKPFRLLPYGLKPKLTDDEMTTIRRLGRPLPCHFALGRNRNLQGLAYSIIKLWEKCEIAKIAVKRGVQNTNTEIMAEELKRLTGGTLLARDREFIVLYRGKDFLPPAVSSAIEERRKYAVYAEKQIAERGTSVTTRKELEPRTEPENKHEWTNDDHKMALPSAKRKLKSAEVVVNRNSIKLSMALEKKAKAEKLLAELENAAIPQQPEIDKEGITKEERYMLRKVGLRMKPFLQMGRRGVFDGTIENMHLHWKYRELVKIICNEKSIEAVQQVAQTLEAESGGILVAVERVNKGYAIIVYRGKNYSRPASLRPQTLLNKREAMKRSIEAQRRESLKLHVLRLNENIDELKLLLVKDKEADNMQSVGESRNELARYKQEVHVTPVNLNDGMGDVVNGPLATQQHEVISFSSTWDEDEIGKFEPGSKNESVTNEEDEIGKVEPGPSNESVTNETHANFLKGTNGEVGDFVSPCFPKDVMGRGKQEAHVTPIKLNDGMGTIVNGQLAVQQDKVITFSSICCEDQNGEVETVSSSEPVTNETHANLFKDVNGEEGLSFSTSFPEDAMSHGLNSSATVDKQHHVSEIEAKDSSGRFGSSESEPSVPVMVRKVFNERPSKSVHLSNGERLLLRKQALKMKKRPMLAVGRNNIVSGVAKTIKAHFEKHPLAIVNVKGRAKGTSVREVVLKLEQATGGVLVSQEPSKVILYRGWGAAGDNDRKASNTGKKVSTRGAVSPELLAAIRLECGFKSPGNEDATPTTQVGI